MTDVPATIGYRRRIGYVLLSGLAGWLAGQLATLPTNLLTAVRDSEGQVRLFVQTIGYGLFVWGAWTFLLASVAILVVAVPLVLAIRPCVLIRFRKPVFLVAAAGALAITVSKLKAFQDPTTAHRLMQFLEALPYGIFATVFAVVTAWVYTSLAKRRLDAAETAAESS